MSPAGSSNAPEARARARIDQALTEAGWTLQDRDDMNLAAADAIAVREFKLDRGHGYVDDMLFLDGHPVGVCEAKPAGTALIGVEHQVKKYVEGIPPALDPPYRPLPFAYCQLAKRRSSSTTSTRTRARARCFRSIARRRCASG